MFFFTASCIIKGTIQETGGSVPFAAARGKGGLSLVDAELLFILAKRYPFWDKLTPRDQAFLAENTRVASYPKGASVHRGDGDCLGVILVKKGVLRTYMLSEEGREITLYRLFEGDMCLLSASCILRSITFEVHIDAEEASEVVITSPSAFAELAKNNIYVESFSHSLTGERFSDVMWAMQQILFMSFDRRLAIFLIDELAKTGGDTVKLTHEQVAKYMGSAREVVTRMLRYFSEEGVVSLSRGGIRVTDRKKLHRLAGQS